MKLKLRDQEFVMEWRICVNRGCTARFKCNEESTQAICSIACYEIATGKQYLKGKTTLPRKPKKIKDSSPQKPFSYHKGFSSM